MKAYLAAAAVLSGFSLPAQHHVTACECPGSTLSKETLGQYEIIFRGKVETVAACGSRPGEAVFAVDELYKGEIPARFTVVFDCDGPCAEGFGEGEEWIIYSRFLQVKNARMDWCSRSRKYFRNENEDHYAVNYGVEYFDEVEYLRNTLGLHRTLSDRPSQSTPRNIRPDVTQSAVILCASLAGIVLFYWLFRRLFK